MKRLLATGMLLAMVAGCSDDYYAKRIIEPDTAKGRICQDLVGSNEQALRHKTVDLAITFPGSDSTTLTAWAIKAKGQASADKPAPTVVLLHGLGESKANYLGIARRLSDKGINAVLVDLRGHGCQSGQYITYGVKEKRDVKTAIDRLSVDGLKVGDIYAFGTNLGGAVAIQYAAIDPRCRGVMAIAPYKDATTIARRILFFQAPTMSEADFRQALYRAGQIAGFDPSVASSVEAAGKLKVPLLLAHGMLDLSVPLDHSQAIYDAAKGPRKLIVITPGPEQLALAMVWEDWAADRLAELVAGKLEGFTTAATTRESR